MREAIILVLFVEMANRAAFLLEACTSFSSTRCVDTVFYRLQKIFIFIYNPITSG